MEAVSSDAELGSLYGVKYYPPGFVGETWGKTEELYPYRVYIRCAPCEVGPQQSLCTVTKQGAVWSSQTVAGEMSILLSGYRPPRRSFEFERRANLPYVNGCATQQVFPPIRHGDPTLQYLEIPPHSKEQAHHIHSTARVVYILSGRGVSIVGFPPKEIRQELLPGMVAILDPMCPHHFETPQGERLVCVPFHVWSSTPHEFGHPMFLGTHLMDQGV